MAELESIYAVLKASEEADQYYKRSCRIAELLGNEFDDRTDDAMGSLINSFKKVVETLPTTEAGLLAKVAFLHKFNEDYQSVFGEMDILPTLVIAA